MGRLELFTWVGGSQMTQTAASPEPSTAREGSQSRECGAHLQAAGAARRVWVPSSVWVAPHLVQAALRVSVSSGCCSARRVSFAAGSHEGASQQPCCALLGGSRGRGSEGAGPVGSAQLQQLPEAILSCARPASGSFNLQENGQAPGRCAGPSSLPLPESVDASAA